MVSQTNSDTDSIQIADNQGIHYPSPQGFLKPYSYLYYNMDIQIITTPSISQVTPPSPGNMSLSTGRAVL